MWRRYSLKWASVVAIMGISYSQDGGTAFAGNHGHTKTYDVVQGYIIQPQSQSQACTPAQASTPTANLASGQSQVTTLAQSPPTPQTMTLQLSPAPVQTLQLSPAPAQTLQLAAAPVQTLQLAAAPVQTLQLAPAPVQTLQLSAPVQVQTLQLTPQSCATQTATPVTLFLPRHRCHWFCRHGQ
jgi:hypothetical protein